MHQLPRRRRSGRPRIRHRHRPGRLGAFRRWPAHGRHRGQEGDTRPQPHYGLRAWLGQGSSAKALSLPALSSSKGRSLRDRRHDLPALDPTGLRACQIEAITNLEVFLKDARPRALIQMATGSGKTFTAISPIYPGNFGSFTL